MQGKRYIRDRSLLVELLLQLENTQQIMQNNVETKHNVECSLLCTLCLHHDFTGVRGNLNAMKHSTKLCLFLQAENIYE